MTFCKDYLFPVVVNMVGTHCCVPRCSSNKTKCRGLSFHYFPKHQEIFKQWLSKIHRDVDVRFKIKPWTVVCSRHFTEDCFGFRNGNSEFTRILKRGAIPTKFAWNNWGEDSKQTTVENFSALKMPREIKTPLRYQTGSEKRQPLRTGKRGRPRLVSNESKPKDTKNATTSSEPVIIADDDDDSDVEIIDVTKPPAKKKKTNYDPDWGIEKKGSSGKAKIKSKEKSAKTSLLATPSRTSESSKVVETQRPSAISISKKCTAPTPSSFIELFMECKDEPLSPAQIQSAQKEQTFYDMSQTLVKAAREGRLIFSPEGGVIILDKPCSMQLAPQAPQTPVLTSSMPIAAHTPPLINTGSSRTKSPDLVILRESPPRMTSNTSSNTPISYNAVKQNQVFNNQGVKTISTLQEPKSNQVIPRSMTSVRAKAQSEALTILRQQMQKDAQAKSESEPAKKKVKKIAQLLDDETGNWVPLDEYYYGKTEGDPTYHEQKGELRFKCWYCNKMLYNNVAAMMHIQGHIDAERQVNLDLSDLTQCKHCYKQFDTPFEMQTHIEKVHMNNANVLLCRICEKDHDSRHALTDHMRRNHNACEMPYICQLCKFRSSMYSDVVDHFKKKHNSSESMLCLYCLRVYQIRFVSQGWGQTSIYYNHLMKHQIKNCCKKCNHCKLVFLNSADLKAHRKTDHMPNQKGVIGINAKYTTPHQVMIKVTEKGDQNGGIKSLNVPAIKKIMEHKLIFPQNVYKVKCIECKMLMGIPDHYKKFIQCSMCRFATSCSFAYAHHMMGSHSGQLTAAASHTPQEAKLQDILYCACGFQSSYGNRIANHLVACSKSFCSKDQPPPSLAGEYGQELQDPRKKPDASLLDVLGLVKKDSLPPSSSRLRYDSPPPEPVEMPEVSSMDILPRRASLLKGSMKKCKISFKEETESKYDESSADDEKNGALANTKPALSDDSGSSLADSKVDIKRNCESKAEEKESLSASSTLEAHSDGEKNYNERAEFEPSPGERLSNVTDPESNQTKDGSQTEKEGSENNERASCPTEKEAHGIKADGERVCEGNETDCVSDGSSTEQPSHVPLVTKHGSSRSSQGLIAGDGISREDNLIKQVPTDVSVKNNNTVKESDDTSLQQSCTYEDGTVFTRGLKSNSRAGLVLATDFNDDDSRVNGEGRQPLNNEGSHSSDFKGFFSDVAAQEEKDSNSDADAQSKVMFDLEESSDSRLVEMSDTYHRLSSTVNKLAGIFSLEEGSSDARDWSDRAHTTTSLMPDDICNVSQTVGDESYAAEKESTSSSSELSALGASKSEEEKQVDEKAATLAEDDETNVDESVALSDVAPDTSDALTGSLKDHTDTSGSPVNSIDQDTKSSSAEILAEQPDTANHSGSPVTSQVKPGTSLESSSIETCCTNEHEIFLPEPEYLTVHLSHEVKLSPSKTPLETQVEPGYPHMPESPEILPYCSNEHGASHAEKVRSEGTEMDLTDVPATLSQTEPGHSDSSPGKVKYCGAQETSQVEPDSLHNEVPQVEPLDSGIPAVSQADFESPDIPEVDQVEPDNSIMHTESQVEPDISERPELYPFNHGGLSIPQPSNIESSSSLPQSALSETHISCFDETNENNISDKSLKSDMDYTHSNVPSTSESLSTIGSEAPSVQGSQSATSADYERSDRARSRSKSRSCDYYRRERRSRSRSHDNYRERRSRSRDADRERSRYDRDRYDRDRGHYRELERDSYDRDRYRHRSRDRDSGRSRDSGRNRDGRDSGHGRDYGRSRDSRDYGHSRDRSDRDSGRYRDRR